MPYIKKERRTCAGFPDYLPENAGELNYAFTELIQNYWLNRKNYQAINDIIGALEGAKLEFTRRVTNNYEDEKIKENSDVYV